MPPITYQSQSFVIDGKPTHVLAASLHYARIHPDQWVERIASARQAGFNTIATACPWFYHEPRKGRFNFEGGADVRKFLECCRDAGMYAIVKLGPYIGDGYDAGGLPGWLIDDPDAPIRCGQDPYKARASTYLRALLNEVAPMQATSEGSVILVQLEHAWRSSNDDEGQAYLSELVRLSNERGIDVPIFNTNDLWQDVPGTLNSWRGFNGLLKDLRQLRSLSDDVPRLVSAFGSDGADADPQQALRALAQVFAAGAHVIVDPYAEQTNFQMFGTDVCDQSRVRSSAAYPGAALREDGSRTDHWRAMKRLLTFMHQFPSLVTAIDPDLQPVALDVDDMQGASKPSVSIITQRGSGGRLVFVFADKPGRSATLLLDNGLSIPVELGDQSVGWYVVGADLAGFGRLDYANVSPHFLVDRKIVVFSGPKKSRAYLSISGTPIEAVIPGGKSPVVVQHNELTLVFCNQDQIDATFDDGERVFVGIEGFDADGEPMPRKGYANATVIESDGSSRTLKMGTSNGGNGRPLKFGTWKRASQDAYINGTAPRYASLGGPSSLEECGIPVGYGWYRIHFKQSSTKKRTLGWPMLRDRAHVFVNGESKIMLGIGPDAVPPTPFAMSMKSGEQSMVVLADNAGRPDGGLRMRGPRGLSHHLYDVELRKAFKAKVIEAEPVDPFDVDGLIIDRPKGQLGSTTQLSWSFSHLKKSPILMRVQPAETTGTFVLNGHPLAYYTGMNAQPVFEMLLQPGVTEALNRGKNELRFAPDLPSDQAPKDIVSATAFFECTSSVTDKATWSFARWEQPMATEFREEAAAEGAPCWWSGRVSIPASRDRSSIWLALDGMTAGHVFVNGVSLSRYRATNIGAKGASVAPRIAVPAPLVGDDGVVQVVLFDEYGADPSAVRVSFD